MKAPKDHWVIQIEITNACVHTCSNCTRFCMHQKKPFMMDYNTFCRAVDSIINHPGLIGVMGGEPTLHPQFKEMCMYLYKKLDVSMRPELKRLAMPTDDFLKMRKRYEAEKRELYEYGDGMRGIIKGAGLWSSMSKEYLENMEIIQETFLFQNLNDHVAASFHQPILISRKDMGIKDEEWFKLREKCWINRAWSSSITPKGCFFCEVAAALDYMYDGPGGLPIEKDWWKRDISDFKEQFRWCELCGIPLKTFSRDARESVTDVSKENLYLMKEHGCGHIDEKHINVVEIENGKILDSSKASKDKYQGRYYIEDANRVTGDAPIYADEFYGVVVYGDSDSTEAVAQAVANHDHKLKAVFTVNRNEGFEELYRVLSKIGKHKYVFCFTPEILLSDEVSKLEKCVINPGTLHYIDFSKSHIEKNMYIKNAGELKKGICLLLNTSANSFWNNLKKLQEDFKSLEDINEVWNPEKVVEFSNAMNKEIYNGVSIRKNEIRLLKAKSYFQKSGILKTTKYIARKIKSVIIEKDKSLWV